jgi:hypothetical protein
VVVQVVVQLLETHQVVAVVLVAIVPRHLLASLLVFH